MYIKVVKEIEVPSGMYCGHCMSMVEYTEESYTDECKEFNRFLYRTCMDNTSRVVKCNECLCAMAQYLRSGDPQ